MRTVLLIGALGALMGSCAGEPDPEPTAADAPRLGAADGTDAADHACQVILRSVTRPWGSAGDGGYATDCSSGECLWVWNAEIDVAATALVGGPSVNVLYHRTDDPSWWTARAELAEGFSPPGLRRYSVRLSEHLFGPDSATTAPIELTAYLGQPDGSRLFDHNRLAGDFDNTVLGDELALRADDVCTPPWATIGFFDGYTDYLGGVLHAGGYMRVEYALERLPECRGTHNGFPAWDIVAHARFSPGGQLAEGSVRELLTHLGTPTGEARSMPWDVAIPDDATSVELWFQNYSGAGSSCEAWDSSYGDNYRFDVSPAVTDPRCAGVEQWTSIYGGAPRCLDYSLDAQYDATHCELFVNGFGHGYEGHYGIPWEWLEAYISVGPVSGTVLGAGMLTVYVDGRDHQLRERFSLGTQIEPNYWKTGFTYLATSPYGDGYTHEVRAFAFFIDVRRPDGTTVRLWQSRNGANYSWDDAFALPTSTSWISYGNVQYANNDAEVFDARRGCR